MGVEAGDGGQESGGLVAVAPGRRDQGRLVLQAVGRGAVRTPSGPISRYAVTPASSSARIVSRNRTGCPTWPTQ